MSDDTQHDTMKLIQAGGNRWRKDDYHRIYFNDLTRWYGLELEHYNTGNISHAELDGETISNNKARKLVANLSTAKLFWDVTEGEWRWKSLEDSQAHRIIERIEAHMQTLEGQNDEESDR